MKSFLLVVVCTTLIFTLVSAQQQAVGYPCTVSNCQICSYLNFCGLCNSGFMLQINSTNSQPYCQAVTCPDTNCQTCYQNNLCSVCNTGFYVGSNGVCVSGTAPNTCSTGCSSCNASACLLCKFGYNLQNGGCFPNNGNSITNCMSTFSSYACQFCQPNYIITPSYQCINNPGFNCPITNCALCNQVGGVTTCKACQPGFTSNGANGCQALQCSVSNCQTCTDSTTCSACLPEYFLNNNQCSLKYYNCGIANCLLCKSSGICAQCAAGYTVTLFTQGSSTTPLGSACNQITSSSGGSVTVSNCQQYGQMIPGTSGLSVGCVSCQTNYTNVGGYCVPNVMVTNYTCNIANCQYCVQNNVCGQCASGYTSFAGTGNVCTPNYSPIPNCLLTPPYIPGSTAICSLCASGYALVDSIACVLIPTTNIVCNIAGCDFCIANNTCQNCLSGYSLANNACSAICTVANCQTCSSNANCQTCQLGYYLSENQCLSAANQPATYCGATFGAACTACTYYACSTCSTGNTLNTASGQCCPTPNYNLANCAAYSTTWSSTACTATFTCTQCNFGAFILVPYPGATPQCTQLPCSIASCAYCYMNDICVVCNQGYTLNNGSCTSFTVPSTCTTPYCTACNSNNVCTSCINGYILYNGQCVCQFQNCLSCQGNAFCTQCAFPTVATITSTAGCLPPISPNTLCAVSNCINCITLNTCAQCDNGFTLQSNGSCTQNTCNRVNNCLLCSTNQQICYVCNPGFIQSTLFGSSCVSIASNYSCQVSGCAVCTSQSATQCQTCSPYYSLSTTTGQCTPYSCVANCVACLSANTCLVCQVGFYLASGSPPSCIADPATAATVACPTGTSQIQGCIGCQSITVSQQTSTVCVMCQYGLQPAQGGQSCIPQTCSVPNCQVCLQNKQANNGLQMCLICQQGYFINSYFQCVSYNPSLSTPNCTGIYNCLYCAYNGSCDYCVPGWTPSNGVCLTSIGCSVANCAQCSSPSICYSCATNYQLSTNNLCLVVCNINGCTTCATTTTCQTCGANFVISTDSTACNCPTSSGFVLNGTSCTCPTGFNIVSGSCVSCNSTLLPYCASCPTADTCGACISSTFTLASGNCTCSSPFVVDSTGMTCGCPAGQLPNNGGCIACNITYCSQCSTAGVCSSCQGTTTPNTDGSQCVCTDNTFSISAAGQCFCPTNTSLLTNTCINCSIQYCSLCSAANVCQTCVNNLQANTAGTACECPSGQTLSNSNCYACSVTNCVVCNATNFCSQCATNFVATSLGACVCQTGYTLSGSTCVQCNVTNCQQCQQANVCSQCMPTFTQVGTPLSCIPCNITSCASCSSPNFCSSCSNNLIVNSQGNVCLSACSVANCALCYNSFTCSSCSVGYQLYNNSRSCISCNLAGCSTCTPTGTCQTCMAGYSLSSGSCVQCLYPCATCTTSGTSTVCATCQPPYSNTPNSNGQCYYCNVQNCVQCSSTNINVCTQCATNYQVSSSGNGNCVYTGVCSVNCVQCAFNTYCAQCTSGYGINSTNTTQCMVCQSYNCATCSSTDYTTCLVCIPGYFLQGGICQACLYPNCQTCDSTGACLTFQANTGLVPLIINNVVNPSICDPGCATCSSINTASCISCKSGYVLGNNNICVPCTYPCLTCTASSPQTCLSCYGNLVLSGSTCTTCTSSSNCLTCSATNTTQCTSCPNGLFLNNGICSGACPVNCAACSSSTACVQCVSGFVIGPSGVCLPCVSNCRFCSGTAPSVCLDCGPGFYLDTSNNQNSCTACTPNCRTCNGQQCLSCIPGYYLNSPFSCAAKCNYPCSSCTSPNSCLGCVAGFTLNNQNQCTFSNCLQGGTCYTCPLGYILSSNTCVQCATNSNCARCNPSTTSQCYSCVSGYFLNSAAQTCSACPTGCATCSSSSSCSTCSSGYTLVLQPVSSAGVCQACASPCATCMGLPSTCLSCVSGYTIQGWSCKTNFNFGFGVNLNTNLATFWSNYQQFLTALVNTTANFNMVTVTSINQIVSSGLSASTTVSVGGIVSTTQQSNSVGSGYQFYYLQNTLASGKTVAGMQIVSGNVAPNGGSVPPVPTPTPQPEPSTNNLAIILGICIPLGVIIIGVIIYFVVVRKSCEKKEDSIEYRSNNTTVRQTFELTNKAEPTL